MSRSRANHHLYLASLLLTGWQQQRAEGNAIVRWIDAAYAPAARRELLNAYGWFLLAIVDPDSRSSGPPPGNCDELPSIVPGMALPGEIREFKRLEHDGWLSELLAPLPDGTAVPARSAGNLLAAEQQLPTPEEAMQWHRQLLAIVTRMSDSMDEC